LPLSYKKALAGCLTKCHVKANIGDLSGLIEGDQERCLGWVADNLRDRLLELGFVIEDAPDGTRWRARKST